MIGADIPKHEQRTYRYLVVKSIGKKSQHLIGRIVTSKPWAKPPLHCHVGTGFTMSAYKSNPEVFAKKMDCCAVIRVRMK